MSTEAGYLRHLYDVVQARRSASTDVSYIAQLFAKGSGKIAQKVGEEAVETAIAAVAGTRQELVAESADLIFHMLILWAEAGVAPEDVIEELRRREGISGLDEKSRRKER